MRDWYKGTAFNREAALKVIGLPRCSDKRDDCPLVCSTCMYRREIADSVLEQNPDIEYDGTMRCDGR